MEGEGREGGRGRRSRMVAAAAAGAGRLGGNTWDCWAQSMKLMACMGVFAGPAKMQCLLWGG